jgi:carboxyl-terminal processing protease
LKTKEIKESLKMRTSKIFIRTLSVCFVFCVLFDASFAQNSGDKPLNQTLIPDSLKEKTFEIVWSAINSQYWDTTFNGVNWPEMKNKYLPKAKEATTTAALHAVIKEMLGELKVSHVGIWGDVQIAPTTTGNGTTGITFRWVENKVLVAGFTPDFSAVDAGISMGDELLSIDGKTVAESHATLNNSKSNLTPESVRRISALNLKGKPGDVKELVFRKPGNVEYKAKIQLQKSTATSNPFIIENREEIAYMKLSIFNMLYHSLLQDSMPELKKAKGWIIDLRGNPGGGEDFNGSFAHWLFKEKGKMGDDMVRGKIETQYNEFEGSGENAYTGPVVILVDEFSGSTSEVFAGGLQDLGRATVIGQRTRGAVLPSTMIPLPTGAQLQIAISQFRTVKGKVLEGVGVKPDIEVPLTQEGLISGKDVIREKATEFLLNSK